ncbi:hypothetical protein K502DRAFT_364142 [Neoconidiobolus thromboides FSU 785]|nr:hypothetical protein K502DRAFT_364142 [Neoconidiobolus thromboides FSU 785]
MTGPFAEKHLRNQGWSKGEGLGKDRKGIKKAITVAKKSDTRGVGAKNDYEFAWWDHVYNKVSSTVQVDNENGEIQVKSTDIESIEKNTMGIISIERPSGKKQKKEEKEEQVISGPIRILNQHQIILKNTLYGYFNKSSAADFQVEDFTTKISDEALFEACGRLSARKGARAEQVGKLVRTGADIAKVVEVNETIMSGKVKKEKREGEDIKKEKKEKKVKKEKKEKKSKKEKEEKKEKKSKKKE